MHGGVNNKKTSQVNGFALGQKGIVAIQLGREVWYLQ